MKKYSFIDLCQQEFSSIEIPLIQRDYAFGRKQEKKKRKRFLDALYKGIMGDGITLDFIYGSKDENDKLIPLDGQQRLTTLFLLHWYAAKHESIERESWNEQLKKFTYKTRLSASRFCDNLINFTPDFNGEDAISEQIKDQVWFSASWKDDPTVASMLQVLDDINETFSGVDNLWAKLCIERKITFFFQPLEDMGITDDVYIKMNSRGKLLTDFEHFKAELIRLVGSRDFSLKIDREWTNLLWVYRDDDNLIDDRFLSYFHFVTDIISVKSGRQRNKSSDYLDMLSLYESVENVRMLESYFDCWVSIEDIESYFKSYLTNEKCTPSKVRVFDWNTNLFKRCCEAYELSFTNAQFLMLYAFVLRNTDGKSIDEEDFRRRLRILRNLVWNSSDELREDKMPSLMEDTEQLILHGNIETVKAFNGVQKEEEIKKLNWCDNHTHDEMVQLFQLEDHQLLYGCTAIIGLDNTVFIRRLWELLNLNLQYLSLALLSSGNYGQIVGSSTWQFANSNSSVWRELLHPSSQRGRFYETQNTIASLLGKCQTASNDELQRIIDDYLGSLDTAKDWRYYLVKYSAILNKAGQNRGKLRWYNGSENYQFYVLNKNTLRGDYWDAILYAIYAQYGEEYKLDIHDGGGPITFLQNDYRLENLEDKFLIKDSKGNKVDEIPIPQTDEIDDQDRVELMGGWLKKSFPIQ